MTINKDHSSQRLTGEPDDLSPEWAQIGEEYGHRRPPVRFNAAPTLEDDEDEDGGKFARLAEEYPFLRGI